MFLLDPLSFPIGVNAGVYRYSQRARTLAAVMTPGVTPTPGGGVFTGATFGTSLNNEGLLAFGGIVPTDSGVHLADEPYLGLGAAVYTADRQGHISTVVSPGDAAPGGGVFDWALFAQINASRDVAFMGHLAGEECRPEGFPPHAVLMACLGSIYVKDSATGQLRSIAHAGDPAPGGGVYRQAISPGAERPRRRRLSRRSHVTTAGQTGHRRLPALEGCDHPDCSAWRSDARRRSFRDGQQPASAGRSR